MTRKKIIIILVILLVLLIILGIFLYVRDNEKNENKIQIDDIEDMVESDQIIVDKPEDLYEEIKKFYTDNPEVTIIFEKEENDCWYFKDSDNNSYYYCLANPVIQKIEKDSKKKQ